MLVLLNPNGIFIYKYLFNIILIDFTGCTSHNKIATLIPNQAVVKYADITGHRDWYRAIYTRSLITILISVNTYAIQMFK